MAELAAELASSRQVTDVSSARAAEVADSFEQLKADVQDAHAKLVTAHTRITELKQQVCVCGGGGVRVCAAGCNHTCGGGETVVRGEGHLLTE